MSNVQSKTVTRFRNHIYDEIDKAGITAITGPGVFAGVFISLGDEDPKIAARLQDVTLRNPEHGVQLLINRIQSNG